MIAQEDYWREIVWVNEEKSGNETLERIKLNAKL